MYLPLSFALTRRVQRSREGCSLPPDTDGRYVLERSLQIFAMGPSYFRDEWNVMDGAIVVTSATADVLGLLSVRGSAFSSLRVLRALRALRLLRLIPRAPGLKRVVNAMIRGLPPVLNVAVVVLVFFLIFRFVHPCLFRFFSSCFLCPAEINPAAEDIDTKTQRYFGEGGRDPR